MAKKPVITAKEAAAMIPNGATIMCGGFLACGQARACLLYTSPSPRDS